MLPINIFIPLFRLNILCSAELNLCAYQRPEVRTCPQLCVSYNPDWWSLLWMVMLLLSHPANVVLAISHGFHGIMSRKSFPVNHSPYQLGASIHTSQCDIAEKLAYFLYIEKKCLKQSCTLNAKNISQTFDRLDRLFFFSAQTEEADRWEVLLCSVIIHRLFCTLMKTPELLILLMKLPCAHGQPIWEEDLIIWVCPACFVIDHTDDVYC